MISNTGFVIRRMEIFWLVVLSLAAFEAIFQSISGRLPERGRKRRERIQESKHVQTTPTRTPTLPYYHPNCRTPRHPTTPSTNGNHCRVGEGYGSDRRRMGYVFHMLCSRYGLPLIPSAPTPTRLWETFSYV